MSGAGPANTSNELKRLAFYGAGPKMAGFNSKSSQNLQLRMQQQQEGKSNAKTKLSPQDPVSRLVPKKLLHGALRYYLTGSLRSSNIHIP